jgi:hypothetical protein
MPPIDDRELRAAAQKLLQEARQVVPRVALGLEAVERSSANAGLVVEVAIGRNGPMTVTLLLDLGGADQKILAQFPNGRD